MPLMQEHNIIFIHIPKNGGTSITNTLNMSLTGHYIWHQHPGFEDAKYTFATIRNPWERVVSAYTYARTRNSYWHSDTNIHPDYNLLSTKTFDEHVDILYKNRSILQHGWSDQSSFIYDDNNNLKVDRLIKLENLNEELQAMFNDLNIDIKVNIPIINNTSHDDYFKYYSNPDNILKVAEVFNRDIDNLGYTYEY